VLDEEMRKFHGVQPHLCLTLCRPFSHPAKRRVTERRCAGDRGLIKEVDAKPLAFGICLSRDFFEFAGRRRNAIAFAGGQRSDR
jgi:hypothetical protein